MKEGDDKRCARKAAPSSGRSAQLNTSTARAGGSLVARRERQTTAAGFRRKRFRSGGHVSEILIPAQDWPICSQTGAQKGRAWAQLYLAGDESCAL
jgi:hypothetical protein